MSAVLVFEALTYMKTSPLGTSRMNSADSSDLLPTRVRVVRVYFIQVNSTPFSGSRGTVYGCSGHPSPWPITVLAFTAEQPFVLFTAAKWEQGGVLCNMFRQSIPKSMGKRGTI